MFRIAARMLSSLPSSSSASSWRSAQASAFFFFSKAPLSSAGADSSSNESFFGFFQSPSLGVQFHIQSRATTNTRKVANASIFTIMVSSMIQEASERSHRIGIGGGNPMSDSFKFLLGND